MVYQSSSNSMSFFGFLLVFKLLDSSAEIVGVFLDFFLGRHDRLFVDFPRSEYRLFRPLTFVADLRD